MNGVTTALLSQALF